MPRPSRRRQRRHHLRQRMRWWRTRQRPTIRRIRRRVTRQRLPSQRRTPIEATRPEERPDVDEGPAPSEPPEARATEAPDPQTPPAAARVDEAPLTLVDVRVVHERDARLGTPGVAFVGTDDLRQDLSSRLDDTVFVRVEVIEQATDVPVLYQLCLVPLDITVAPACTNAQLLRIESSRSVSASMPWDSLSSAQAIDWTEGIEGVMLVLRRLDGLPIDRPAADPQAEGGEPTSGLPMRVHVQAVAVPAGVPFPGWP